jgi:hypothetical protein
MKTTGVIEHIFTVRGGRTGTLMDWKICDVGGERNRRQAWAPYFDDVNDHISRCVHGCALKRKGGGLTRLFGSAHLRVRPGARR